MAVPGSVEILRDRLFWVSLRSRPSDTADAHFFCVDDTFVYWNFFLDFGPYNLGQLYRFCQIMSDKLHDPRFTGARFPPHTPHSPAPSPHATRQRPAPPRSPGSAPPRPLTVGGKGRGR